MRDFTASNTFRYEGDYILKGDTHMRYSPHSKGITELRVIPAVIDGQPEPMIIGQTQALESLGHLFAKVDMVSFFGPNSYSMIAPGPYSGDIDGVPIRESRGPIHFFVDYIMNFVDANPRTCPPKWRRWLGGREEGDTVKPRAVIARPSRTALLQGYLVQHKGELMTDRDGNPTLRGPVVLCIRGSGHDSLFDQVLTQKDPNAPWGPLNNALGDIATLETGTTVIVEPFDVVFNNMNQIRYRCKGGEQLPLSQEEMVRGWKPWEEILDLEPPLEELGVRLAMAFDADTVVQVFSGCPLYHKMITSTVLEMADREKGITRTTVQAGASLRPSPTVAPAPRVAQEPEDEEGEFDFNDEPSQPTTPDPAKAIEANQSRIEALRARMRK